MTARPEQIKANCEALFNKRYEGYRQSGELILLSYFGTLDQSLTFILSNKVEQILERHEPSRNIIKRIFSILIESLQNVRHHSYKTVIEDEIAGIIVTRSDKYYAIRVMNLADENARLILQNRIDQINDLNNAQLKTRYLETMTNGMISDKGGAGLGIITMALKSRQKIELDFDELSSGLYLVNLCFRIALAGSDDAAHAD